VHTSVDTSKPVSSLSASDAAQLCSDLNASAASAVSPSAAEAGLCEVNASLAGASAGSPTFDVAKCQSASSACIMMPPMSIRNAVDCQIATKAAACSATVAAVDQCFSDELMQILAAASQGANVCVQGSLDGGSRAPAGLYPASCASLSAGCQAAIFG
jgi:hypothetical protein